MPSKLSMVWRELSDYLSNTMIENWVTKKSIEAR